jgi:uncharacterized membrane-anchored protein
MPAGYFVRHKTSGFETFIPAEHWHKSFEKDFHIRDPEAELEALRRDMMEASELHDAEVARRAEEAAEKAARKLAPPSKGE